METEYELLKTLFTSGNGHGLRGAGKGAGVLYGIVSGGNFLNHTILGYGLNECYHRQQKSWSGDGNGSGGGARQ